MRNLTDWEIINSINKGNYNDFNLLMDRYKHKAFSLLMRMLKNQMDAEEVLQDAFLKTYYGLKNFRGESQFSTWFYKIVYNSAISKLNSRKNKFQNSFISIDEELKIPFDEKYEIKDENLNTIVNKLMEQLPPNYSAVINLYYLDGYSCEEIASIMNLSVSNVKVLLHRSRKALKELIIKNKLEEELK